MKTAKLSKEQRAAMVSMDNASYKFRQAFKELQEAWNELEATNSPIGFMDYSYPFTEKFDTTKDYVDYWCSHIENFIQQTINK